MRFTACSLLSRNRSLCFSSRITRQEVAAQPRPEIINFFSDRYFPGAPKVEFLKTPVSELKAIEGQYQATRRAETTKLKLSNLFEQRTAKVDKDGVLTIEDVKDLRGHPIKWKPIGKDLWQAEDDQEKIFAIRDSKGKIARIADRVSRACNLNACRGTRTADSFSRLRAPAWAFCFWFSGGSHARWEMDFPAKASTACAAAGNDLDHVGPRMAAFVWVLFLGGLAVFFIVKGDDLMPPTPSWFQWFALINWITALALLLSLFASLSAIRIWRREKLRWITKVKFSLVGFACVF